MKKVVLITGGTAGIGQSMAEAFIAQGVSVAICGRSTTALNSFSRAHPEALAIKADVTIAADRAAMLDAVAKEFGSLDVLINNAGTFVERDFKSGKDATLGLEEEVALNLTAPIQLTSEVLNRWPAIGSIVFVSSGFALISPSRAPTYGAVKAGLHAFAEGLRRQLAPKGTHILELLPSLTDTRMNANDVSGQKKMRPEEVASMTLKAIKDRQTMSFPGSSKWIPMLLRIAPKTANRMIGNL